MALLRQSWTGYCLDRQRDSKILAMKSLILRAVPLGLAVSLVEITPPSLLVLGFCAWLLAVTK